ncbi:MAG TPA: nucleic acid/nucleotide deaminase domain-containing protein, partial [Longimicrobium sp.]
MPPTRRAQAMYRRTPGYHNARLQSIKDLDKVASFVLASSYSRRTSPTKASQGLIQMDCVAVAVVNGEWLFASNSHRITDEDIEMVADELGQRLIYAIVERGTHMHAEMQVLEEIRASGHQIADVYVGVSKPCCEQCKKVLDKHGAGYTAYHEDNVVNWEKP